MSSIKKVPDKKNPLIKRGYKTYVFIGVSLCIQVVKPCEVISREHVSLLSF